MKPKEENQLFFKIQVGHGFGFGSFHFIPGKAQGSLILPLKAAEEGFVYIYNSVCKRTGLLPCQMPICLEMESVFKD